MQPLHSRGEESLCRGAPQTTPAEAQGGAVALRSSGCGCGQRAWLVTERPRPWKAGECGGTLWGEEPGFRFAAHHLAGPGLCRAQPTSHPGGWAPAWLRQALLGNSQPGEQGFGARTPSFPSPPTPPTLLQAVERQRKLAHKVIRGGSVIIFHHKPDQHQLRSPQLELQGLPPAGVEA